MKLSHLEVRELRVLLLQDVGHVVDQVQTKSILGGDFLFRDRRVFIGWTDRQTYTHTEAHLCIRLHSQRRA